MYNIIFSFSLPLAETECDDGGHDGDRLYILISVFAVVRGAVHKAVQPFA